MKKNHFLLLKKVKNTSSGQLCLGEHQHLKQFLAHALVICAISGMQAVVLTVSSRVIRQRLHWKFFFVTFYNVFYD